MVGRVVGGLALVVICITSVARADEGSEQERRAQARKHFNEGTRWYELGHFDEAIKEYEQAYRSVDDPVLLYNLAQAHRQAGHTNDALRLYKVYLNRAPKAPNRSEVETKIAALEKVIEDQRQSQSIPPDHAIHPGSEPPATASAPTTKHPPATTPPATTSEPTKPPVRARAVVVTPQPADADEPVPGRNKKIAGIVVAAVGVGAVGAGIALSILAKQASDSVTADAKAHLPFDPAKESTGRTDQIVGPVLIGVGAAAVVAGGVVYFLGHRDARAAGRSGFVLAPALAPRFAGVALQGGF
jgi:tetratricopeptide (TPR) repeat protein